MGKLRVRGKLLHGSNGRAKVAMLTRNPIRLADLGEAVEVG
jgi:hypothetical protein